MGSEMCIRDSISVDQVLGVLIEEQALKDMLLKVDVAPELIKAAIEQKRK